MARPRGAPTEPEQVLTPKDALAYIRDDESGFGVNPTDTYVLSKLVNRRAKRKATRRELVEVARVVLENLGDDTTAYLSHEASADREREMLQDILDALGGD